MGSNLPPGVTHADIDRHFVGAHDHEFVEPNREIFEDGAFMVVYDCNHGLERACEATKFVRLDASSVAVEQNNGEWNTVAESDTNVFHDIVDGDTSLSDEDAENIEASIAEATCDRAPVMSHHADGVSIDCGPQERGVYIDGANFRFSWDDGQLYVGTRNHSYPAEDENAPKAFRHAIEYVQDMVDQPLPDNITLFGEAMHLHSLDYDGIEWHNPHKGSPHVPLDSDLPNVVIFDAYDSIDDVWLHWDSVTEIAHSWGFETARVLERGEPDELTFEVPEESQFGGPPEGIVVRRTDGTVRAKKVTEDFKERNAQAFNGPQKAQTAAGEFTALFVTPARIQKIAHKLVDNGEYDSLQMQMMEQVPAEVCKDVMAEEGWNLLQDEYGFECQFDADFKSAVRSKVSTMCARELREELQSL